MPSRRHYYLDSLRIGVGKCLCEAYIGHASLRVVTDSMFGRREAWNVRRLKQDARDLLLCLVRGFCFAEKMCYVAFTEYQVMYSDPTVLCHSQHRHRLHILSCEPCILRGRLQIRDHIHQPPPSELYYIARYDAVFLDRTS